MKVTDKRVISDESIVTFDEIMSAAKNKEQAAKLCVSKIVGILETAIHEEKMKTRYQDKTTESQKFGERILNEIKEFIGK